MKQTIQKFSRYCERWFRELLMKHTVLFCCVAALAAVGCTSLAYGHMRILTALYAIGAVLAASVALIQWASDRRVKRAELLDQLIEKITTIDPNSLRGSESRESESVKAALQEKELTDKLAFLSYVAYLEATGILSDDEFSALRLDLVRILENRIVLELIVDACRGNKGSKNIPYRYLVQYGALNCEPTSRTEYKALLDIRRNVQPHEGHGAVAGTELQQQPSEGVIDTVSSGRTYATHLDVLNGIFRLGYRAHMRGGATLPDGRVVWFPKYYDSASRKQVEGHPAKWLNILDAKEGVLSEYWPLAAEPRTTWHKGPRYVFGMDMSGSPLVYRFLGIYKYERREGNHLVYKRQDVVLRRDAVECSLHPGNSGNY